MVSCCPCIVINTKLVVFISGESGLVYKGYLDTALGKELVAVKTGKGKFILTRMNLTTHSLQLYSPKLIWRDWQRRYQQCCHLNTQMSCLSLESALMERCPYSLCHSCPTEVSLISSSITEMNCFVSILQKEWYSNTDFCILLWLL